MDKSIPVNGIPTKFTTNLSQSQFDKIVKVSQLLKIQPVWLMAVMWSESRFKTTAKNPDTHAVGLIQFTRDEKHVNHPELDFKLIGGKKYLIDTIHQMTFEQQMDLVYLYFSPYKGKIKDFISLYMLCFFPLAYDKSLSFVFETKKLSASSIAKVNKAYDLNKDSKITKGEVVKYFQKYYGDLDFNMIQVGVKDWNPNQSLDNLIHDDKKKRLIKLLTFFLLPFLLLLLLISKINHPMIKKFYNKYKKIINWVFFPLVLIFVGFRIYKIFKK